MTKEIKEYTDGNVVVFMGLVLFGLVLFTWAFIFMNVIFWCLQTTILDWLIGSVIGLITGAVFMVQGLLYDM